MEIFIKLAPYGGALILAAVTIYSVLVQRGSSKKQEIKDRSIARLESSLQAIIELKKWSRQCSIDVSSFVRNHWPEVSQFQPQIPFDLENWTPKSHEEILSAISLFGETSYDVLLNLLASYYPQQFEDVEEQLGKRFHRFRAKAGNVISYCVQKYEEQKILGAFEKMENSYIEFNDTLNKTTIEIRKEIRQVHLS